VGDARTTCRLSGPRAGQRSAAEGQQRERRNGAPCERYKKSVQAAAQARAGTPRWRSGPRGFSRAPCPWRRRGGQSCSTWVTIRRCGANHGAIAKRCRRRLHAAGHEGNTWVTCATCSCPRRARCNPAKKLPCQLLRPVWARTRMVAGYRRTAPAGCGWWRPEQRPISRYEANKRPSRAGWAARRWCLTDESAAIAIPIFDGRMRVDDLDHNWASHCVRRDLGVGAALEGDDCDRREKRGCEHVAKHCGYSDWFEQWRSARTRAAYTASSPRPSVSAVTRAGKSGNTPLPEGGQGPSTGPSRGAILQLPRQFLSAIWRRRHRSTAMPCQRPISSRDRACRWKPCSSDTSRGRLPASSMVSASSADSTSPSANSSPRPAGLLGLHRARSHQSGF